MNKRKEILLLIFLVVLLLIINYNFIDSAVEKFLDESRYGIVTRIIDGDTVVINNESVRLLGVNCPERGEKYYEEAGEFLSEKILNKNVKIEGSNKDKYYRNLRYIFVNGKNINVEMVENGLANVYILDDRSHEKELRDAWNDCIENNKFLCEKSNDECAKCIELKEFDYKNQEVIFHNKCDFNCDLTGWTIKDEGRKKFIFDNFVLGKNKDVTITADDFNKDYVWTSTGDTLFLRDGENKLVLWEMYS